ncbi:MAG: HAD hydrolase family protein [Anaerolineales bacterium]|nr:HAD hydrolase family protein [Anaerolineales bacterium]
MTTARILITEDSLGVARALSKALAVSRPDDYTVEICSSAETAQEKMGHIHYDLLITDLRLPGQDGMELLEWTRQHSTDTRGILITAYGSPQIEQRVLLFANAYLPKPFHLNDLIRLVELVLSAPPTTPSPSPPLPEPPQVAVIETGEVDQQQPNHLTILATDLDGTLAEYGKVEAATWQALHHLKAAGFSIILVTGRMLESVTNEWPTGDLCEAIVAENGAIVYFPRRDIISFPFGRLTPAILHRLNALSIPLERGMAIVATHVPHDQAVLNVLREVGGGATVEYNRGAVMVLPLGATKGTGLKYALDELGYSVHNVVACGDAENDRSLFEVAELAVAVANAPPGIKALADTVLLHDNGIGMQVFLRDLANGRLAVTSSRPYRRLTLGNTLEDTPLNIDPATLLNGNLGIFGSSASGKSWLAGLLTEELLKQGYQVCIIDPEGDYRALSTSPHTLLFGGAQNPLPGVANVSNFFESSCLSLILDLSVYDLEERSAYLLELLRVFNGIRLRRGRPHWYLIDEAQSFLSEPDGELAGLLMETMQQGGFGLVSYRPSQIPSPFRQRLEQLLLTHLAIQEDLDALRLVLDRIANSSQVLSELPTLPIGQAFLCQTDVEQWLPAPPAVVKFQVGPRSVPHIRHLHKYLRAPLPAPKRFYFHDENGRYLSRVAANLWEFCEICKELPLSSLEYHLRRGDFERWLADVLQDSELPRQVHKLSHRGISGEELRQALVTITSERYQELDRLV